MLVLLRDTASRKHGNGASGKDSRREHLPSYRRIIGAGAPRRNPYRGTTVARTRPISGVAAARSPLAQIENRPYCDNALRLNRSFPSGKYKSYFKYIDGLWHLCNTSCHEYNRKTGHSVVYDKRAGRHPASPTQTI